MNLKYLVTGTGRCGTVYMARFLTSIGIPCGHEAVFNFNGLSNAKKILNEEKKPKLSTCSTQKFIAHNWLPEEVWLDDISSIQADSSYMAAPFLSDEILKDTKIIHIVRNPFLVARSFCKLNYFKYKEPNNHFEEFIYSHLNELKNDMRQYDRSCLYYVLWNEKIEKNKIDLFLKIEDKKLQDKMSTFLDKKIENHYNNKKVNSFYLTKQIFDFNYIENEYVKEKFHNIAKRYGYSIIQNKYL